MLVLTRKKDESIMLGDNIEVKILSVEGDQVKLGIVAPENVRIFRSEVYQSIQEQNKEAANINQNLFNQIKKNN
ncbi:carbon storage regulator CsrA [Chungangia koreensis]|uniref:Translational regulator CsrA n=1 Tax=Chungangia koreensis TaxID=752657 RepID=A0ABV8X663_9LACT